MAERKAGEPFTRLSPNEAKKLIDRGDVQVVDVRQPGEWAVGHLKGAVLIPVDALFERIDEVAEDKDVLFYCAMGVRSALACEIGAAMGRTKVHNMEGGIEAWKAGALPVVKD